MSLVRVLARPMLASMFIVGGIDAVTKPEPKAELSGDIGTKIAKALPVPMPEDPVMLVRINGGVQVAAGLMLATGKMPRLSALALALSLVPTTYAGHRFWEQTEQQSKRQQRIHFFKNVSMIGGLLIAAADPGSKGSLAHRAGDAAHKVTDKVR